jgi:hypothetical protein
MFLILTLIINLVAAILLLISGGEFRLSQPRPCFFVRINADPFSLPRDVASNGGADLGAAIMYVPVIGVLSFLLWCESCLLA